MIKNKPFKQAGEAGDLEECSDAAPEATHSPEDLGELLGARDYGAVLALLAKGGFEEFCDDWWMGLEPARCRTPILLICAGEYDALRFSSEPEPDSPSDWQEEEMMAALIKAGCPLGSVDDYGRSALGCAALRGKLGLAKILLAAGADAEASGAEMSPLAQALLGSAAHCGAVAWALLEAGADLDSENLFGRDLRPTAREDVLSERDPADDPFAVVRAFEDQKALASEISSEKSVGKPLRM